MTLSNSEQEMVWVDAWNDLYELIGKFPEGCILLPEFQEATKEEAKGWIQDSVYKGNRIEFKVDYFKGKESIYINLLPV